MNKQNSKNVAISIKSDQILAKFDYVCIIAFSTLAVLVAGAIRGYSGFGFSMIATTSLTLVLPPVEVIPVVLVLEYIPSTFDIHDSIFAFLKFFFRPAVFWITASLTPETIYP